MSTTKIKTVVMDRLSERPQFPDAEELVKSWRWHIKVMSWAPHAYKLFHGKVLRFAVNGHHHRGHVYIAPNASDLFDVYITTLQGTIIRTVRNTYLDMLIEVIDEAVERIDEYKI